MKFFQARKKAYHTNPKLIDDVIYTPYVYDPPANLPDPSNSPSTSRAPTGDLLGIPELREVSGEERAMKKAKSKFDTAGSEAEIFMFSYGTVVIWGMTEAQEKRFLSSMSVRIPHAEMLLLIYHIHRRRFEVGRLGNASLSYRAYSAALTNSVQSP
jgi:uncharacterized Rmd1/YagE family protein